MANPCSSLHCQYSRAGAEYADSETGEEASQLRKKFFDYSLIGSATPKAKTQGLTRHASQGVVAAPAVCLRAGLFCFLAFSGACFQTGYMSRYLSLPPKNSQGIASLYPLNIQRRCCSPPPNRKVARSFRCLFIFPVPLLALYARSIFQTTLNPV